MPRKPRGPDGSRETPNRVNSACGIHGISPGPCQDGFRWFMGKMFSTSESRQGKLFLFYSSLYADDDDGEKVPGGAG